VHVGLDVRHVAERELAIAGAISLDGPEVELGRVKDRAPCRGTVNDTRPVRHPREATEVGTPRDLSRLTAWIRGHDDHALVEDRRDHIALERDPAVVG
jgi:hypothetical protein